MAITLNGTTGITTPADTITGNATVGGTLAVTGATTVGGVAVVAVAPSTAGNVLTSTGSAWTSAAPASSGGQLQTQIFTSNTTWTCPTGVTKVYVICVGGGGGTAWNKIYCTATAYGGFGGIAVASVSVTPGTVYTITIGTPANSSTGSTSGTVSGGNGATVSFGSLVTSTGGTGGYCISDTPYSGASGTGSTTGTLIRSATINAYSGTNSPIAGPLFGNQYFGGASGVAFSTSSSYGAGAYGGTTASFGGIATGAIGGAIMIQYAG